MAKRPIFIPKDVFPFVEEKEIEFKWHPGFSVSQKQKSIKELHDAASDLKLCKSPLEISSKSEVSLGVNLSAFNLKVTLDNHKKVALENVFQASKIFDQGGPFIDLLYVTPLEAKRDIRLKESGDLKGFRGKGQMWPLEPKTIFYDWIYINALKQNLDLLQELENYDSFSDIEFNPSRSFNCQARSAALYLGLKNKGLLVTVLSSPESFIGFFNQSQKETSTRVAVQKSLI